jgi:CRISPR-associated protein Cmr1
MSLNEIPKIRFKERKKIEVEIEFLTPMFGGGISNEKKPDPVCPIRGSSIRGQLRFWWRATASAETAEDFRKKEKTLWGGIAGGEPMPSKVLVSIHPGKNGKLPTTKEFELFNKKHSGLDYAGFALRPENVQQNEKPKTLTKIKGSFVLRLDIHDLTPQEQGEVHTALDAWLCFGGLGGRTRRGFGAIAPTNRPINPEEFLDRVKKEKKAYTLKKAPTLFGAELKTISWKNTKKNTKKTDQSGGEEGVELLNEALIQFQNFRQFPRKLTREKRDFSASAWPEANEIRRAQFGRANRGEDPATTPRAVFGMPIIFHFPQQKGRDPVVDTTLKPKGKERLASPLILRPFRKISPRDQGKKELSLIALCFPTNWLDGQDLELVWKQKQPATIKFEKFELKSKNGQTLSLEPTILEAFISYLEKNLR